MKLQTAKFGCLALFAAVLAALLIPACGCWVRSHWVTDDIGFHRPARFTRVRTSGGGLWFETRPWPGKTDHHTEWDKFTGPPLYPFDTASASTFSQRCGFLFSTQGYDLMFVVPYWSIVGTLTSLLIMSVIVLCKQSSPSSGGAIREQ